MMQMSTFNKKITIVAGTLASMIVLLTAPGMISTAVDNIWDKAHAQYAEVEHIHDEYLTKEYYVQYEKVRELTNKIKDLRDQYDIYKAMGQDADVLNVISVKLQLYCERLEEEEVDSEWC